MNWFKDNKNVNGSKQGLIVQQWTRDILGISNLHQRPDRDKYIVVRKDNVEEERQKYFDIEDSDEENVKYDFGSILHPPYDVSYNMYSISFIINNWTIMNLFFHLQYFVQLYFWLINENFK